MAADLDRLAGGLLTGADAALAVGLEQPGSGRRLTCRPAPRCRWRRCRRWSPLRSSAVSAVVSAVAAAVSAVVSSAAAAVPAVVSPVAVVVAAATRHRDERQGCQGEHRLPQTIGRWSGSGVHGNPSVFVVHDDDWQWLGAGRTGEFGDIAGAVIGSRTDGIRWDRGERTRRRPARHRRVAIALPPQAVRDPHTAPQSHTAISSPETVPQCVHSANKCAQRAH